ncbi:hypothetical protein [Streptomyces neyagawaensis]|uniref:hypothetical protein n=1 Tax=Streptomyces neyagawaensis TaxID=42238 RepID=UPI0006E1A75A|nr:hypothetical protein [Streptomyces neyagawaensis]MCL6732840.1 hypothetical protein [Streptomyces neyagawaensis]MDE1681391.1 hypothetical protein [Streptomyces neyagawaensis]
MTEAGGAARFLLGGLLGLTLGVGLVGGAWLITGDDSDEAPGAAGAPAGRGGELSAPAKLGRFIHQDEAVLELDASQGKELAERNRDWDGRSGELLSEAHGGAAATVQSFSDSRLESFFQFAAVRGPSPRPYVPYADPSALGLEKPTNERVTFGKVDCVLHHQPTNAGNEPEPDSVSTVSCQRGDERLTVLVRDVTGDLTHEPSEVARLVDEAWAGLT